MINYYCTSETDTYSTFLPPYYKFLQTKDNFVSQNYSKLTTTQLKQERDRLLAEIEQINEELTRRGENPESKSELVRLTDSQLTNQDSGKGSGWLDPFTVQKKNVECPHIVGKRDQNNPKHFYWKYRWINDVGKTRSKYCPQKKVEQVRAAIQRSATPDEILQLITKGGAR